MKENTIQASLYALTFALAAGLGIAKSFAGEELVVTSSDLSPSITLSDLMGSYRIEKGPTDCSSELVVSLKQDDRYQIKFSDKRAVVLKNGKMNTGYIHNYTSSDYYEGLEYSYYKKVVTNVSSLDQKTLKIETETSYADGGIFNVPFPRFGSKLKVEQFKLDGVKLQYKLNLKKFDGEEIKLTCQYTKY